MAAVTDLTWQQVLDKLPANSIVIAGGKVMLDVSVITGSTIDALTDVGVIKAITALLNAGLLAQNTANTGQAAGEKLAAFGTPTNGAIANGFAPVTRTFVSRSELATAINIVGQVA